MKCISIGDWIQIAIAGITLLGILVSIVIAIVTRIQNTKAIKEANRAQIIFYIDYNPACDMYFLIIKNFGKSIGKLIKVDIDPKLDWNKSKFSQDVEPLTESTNIMLAPNQKVSSWFEFHDYPDKKFNVKLEYNTMGKVYKEEYCIDLEYIKNVDWITPYPIDDHTKDNKAVLYKINNSIRDLTDKFR